MSLRLTIALIFGTLILLFGSILIGYNYHENKSIAVLAAAKLSDNINLRVASRLSEIYAPVRQFVDINAAISPAMPEDSSSMLQLAIPFSHTLKLNPGLSSVYLANAAGDFFIVRNLALQKSLQASYNPPPTAQFLVQLIIRNAQSTSREINLFLDADLSQLGSEQYRDSAYDPRQRDWYQSAIASQQRIVSDFYLFFSTKEVGITMARKLAGNEAVVAADITLQQLSEDLATQQFTPSTRILLTDNSGQIIAHAVANRTQVLSQITDSEQVQLNNLQDTEQGIYRPIYTQLQSNQPQTALEFKHQGKKWFAYISPIPAPTKQPIYLATLVPGKELLADVAALLKKSVLISLILLLLTVLISTRIAHGISGSIQQLSTAAEQIREFKLDTPIHVSSKIAEVDNLSHTMSLMQKSIEHFLKISKALSAEKDFPRLLQLILQEGITVGQAQAGAILLTSADEQYLECAIVSNPDKEVTLNNPKQLASKFPPHKLGETGLDNHVLKSGEPLLIDDLDNYQALNTKGVQQRFKKLQCTARSLLCVPLVNQKDESIGVIQLVRSGDTGFNQNILSYIEALSSDAAVALDNRRLLKSEEDLLDAFIQVLAGAIDAKSAYTGGHCQRVPELAQMLAEAATRSSAQPFKEFSLSAEDKRQLHIASWLHDCGKVTTPEHVVDKATRLETLYNRIHEIRMRFEVLWRDSQIEYLQARLDNLDTVENLQATMRQQLDSLRDDFEFVANCNQGSTFMDEEKLQRLKKIGSRSWQRQFDDQLGLSAEEAMRRPEDRPTTLPVTEQLLQDRPQDLVPWPTDKGATDMQEFTLRKPEYAFNHGELHNLSITRGTLTGEERYKINEHIIQTIRMLKQMPFPKGLRQVPDWAGNHHEQLNGSGYPRSLVAADLSIPERIMAIADIFEALTASDRPYKSAKSLSQSLNIMQEMSDRGHICPDLFKLFIDSGAYREYGEKFLAPEQLV